MVTTPLEIDEQSSVVYYLQYLKNVGRVVVYSAVPNNTWTKSWSQKAKQKKLGVMSGVPDLIVVTPTKVFFIEMKRQKRGKVMVTQDEWIDAINTTGVPARVCHGFEEAKDFINEQIKS